MKIAILYICTGKYNQFFEGFYTSSERYFLTEKADKTYYVWTDDNRLSEDRSNVVVVHKECEGFPADSLFRFEMFLQKKEELEMFDYIYFFNSNFVFLQPIGEEILPDETGLAMGIWPDIQNRPAMFYSYERNKKSLAYIAPYNPPYIYYMGGLNGGTSEAYLRMIKTLAHNIRDDYNRGIIAKIHDESHINAYMRTHTGKILGEEYCWAEEWGVDHSKKMILRDKVKLDSYFNKGRKHGVFFKLLKGFYYLKNAVIWYL